jgi:hypothetical protein
MPVGLDYLFPLSTYNPPSSRVACPLLGPVASIEDIEEAMFAKGGSK